MRVLESGRELAALLPATNPLRPAFKRMGIASASACGRGTGRGAAAAASCSAARRRGARARPRAVAPAAVKCKPSSSQKLGVDHLS